MSSTVLLTQRVALSAYIPSLEPQCGDLVLIQHPPRLPQGETIFELLVVDTAWPISPADLVLRILLPEYWILFEKIAISDSPASRLTLGPHRALEVPRDRTVDAGTTITLRPTNQVIRNSLFGGHCPYEMCNYGIVVVTENSFDDLSLGESSQTADLTLCPFCMGVDILRYHEELVKDVANVLTTESATEELLRDAAIRTHRQNINNRRLELGYMDLPDDHGLYGLGRQAGTDFESVPAALAVEYLTVVARGVMTPPASPAQESILDLSPPPTRITRGDEHHASATRGRKGRRARGNVEFRRLDRDPRPESSYTYEIPLDDQLDEATLRIQDYHRTLMAPPPRRTLQIGDGSAVTTALEITEPGEAALQEAVRRADHTDPIMHGPRPGTPIPPPAMSSHIRGAYKHAICTQPFRWYKLVSERVLDEICAICHERFENGPSLITSLPCGHFFHEECIRGRTKERMAVICPYRCEGHVQI